MGFTHGPFQGGLTLGNLSEHLARALSSCENISSLTHLYCILQLCFQIVELLEAQSDHLLALLVVRHGADQVGHVRKPPNLFLKSQTARQSLLGEMDCFNLKSGQFTQGSYLQAKIKCGRLSCLFSRTRSKWVSCLLFPPLSLGEHRVDWVE